MNSPNIVLCAYIYVVRYQPSDDSELPALLSFVTPRLADVLAFFRSGGILNAVYLLSEFGA